MTDSQKTLNDDYEYELSLLDLLVILVQQRWLIIKITAAFAIIAVIYALTATPIYRSTMQIISPTAERNQERRRCSRLQAWATCSAAS